MKFSNTYVEERNVTSTHKIQTFIKGKVFSNHENYEEMITYLNEDKNKSLRNFKNSSYKNIYAHSLKVLIPKDLHKQSYRKKFIEKFMYCLDKQYKDVLYIYKFSRKGKGLYGEIIAFTRLCFPEGKCINATYHRDYIYNSKTKKICKKDDSYAVVLHKKGDFKLDKDGQPIKLTIYVDTKETIQKFKFSYLAEKENRLRKAIVDAYEILTEENWKTLTLPRETIKKNDSAKEKARKESKNNSISSINKFISNIQKSIISGGFIEDGFKDPFCKVKKVISELLSKIEVKLQVHKMSFEDIEHYLKTWCEQFFSLV